jgi:transposase
LIAVKIGCAGETLRGWVRQAERDQGQRAGLTTDERERMKALECENRELTAGQRGSAKALAYLLRQSSAFLSSHDAVH